MYSDEEIFTRVSAAMKKIGPPEKIGDFRREYERLFVYPSHITIKRKYGGWRRLIIRTMDWEMKRIVCGIMLAGTYWDQTGRALIKIQPNKEYFQILTLIDGKKHRWKIPRKEI